MKMYVLILDDVSLGLALVAAAHGHLACYLKFRDDPAVQEWVAGPFNKSVCKVTRDQYNLALRNLPDPEGYVVITESTAGGRETAIVFKPRSEWPKAFSFFPLYRER